MAKRLKSLDEVIGHAPMIKWFKGCIQRDALPQVIMLSGPTGIGKTSIAQIVACEIAYMNQPDKMAEAKKAVIEEGKSTDAVRLYNMSNLKSQEAVSEVKSDLSIGFSSTGRKVIIMDEAHGMSDEAQDSLLVAFEALQAQVYIIVCSTELSTFREAFVGRCLLRRLTNLSSGEMRQLLKRRIEDNELKFELSLNVVYSLISMYTGREPRRALNLLDSFERGSTVATEELNTFLNVYEGNQLLTLIRYLVAGDVLAGLSFIGDCELGTTFQKTLLEILKVALGGQSPIINRDGTMWLYDVGKSKEIQSVLGFCMEVSMMSRVSRTKLSGIFIRWSSKQSNIIGSQPVQNDVEKIKMQDIAQMRTMLEEKQVHSGTGTDTVIMSLESLLAESETID